MCAVNRIVLYPPELPEVPDGLKTAGWWHDYAKTPGSIQCDLCPRGCILKEGAVGFCMARKHQNGRLVSTVFGRSTGFCIDPIEKKPLNHFYPSTGVLSFGTTGCNLACEFCQNWSTSRSPDAAAFEAAEPAVIAAAAKELGCRSVAFTYNEPTVFAEYAIETARECRQLGIQTVAVTNGFISATARKAFFEAIDAANVDLKGFRDDFYRRFTHSGLDPILDTLGYLARETNVWLEVTNLIIPGENDSADEIQRLVGWVLEELGPKVPVHFSAFHPAYRMMDHPATPSSTLDRAHAIAKAAGLHYVYTGNLLDREHQSTYCPGCGKPVIVRTGFAVESFGIRGGACAECGEPIAGRFDDSPGSWGAKRQPVEIARYASSVPRKKAEALKKPLLTEEQDRIVFLAACRRVVAAVQGTSPPSMAEMLGDAAKTPVYGAFVTLKRAGQLRSCCGHLQSAAVEAAIAGYDAESYSMSLAGALEKAAVRAALDDPRFPSISAAELHYLHVDVWLLWGLCRMRARGEDRVAAVEIGKHGLQIARGHNQGLLLPGVATEHHLDARQFLEHVCLKANLPTNAWKSDDTVIMTFEGRAVEGPMEADEKSPSVTEACVPVEQLKKLAAFCGDNLVAAVTGATPSFYMPGVYDGSVCGVALDIAIRTMNEPLRIGVYSLRSDKPLQATLLSLVQQAAPVLRAKVPNIDAIRQARVELTVLTDPAMHGQLNRPDLAGVDPACRALLVADRQRSAWLFDPSVSVEALLVAVSALLPNIEPEKTTVVSFAAASTGSRASGVNQPPAAALGEARRAPAVAGMFYPGTAAEIASELEAMLDSNVLKETWQGAIVPHAGWVYSGRLAAKTLSRIQFPSRVILLCPKHRAGGAEWAVAPHEMWTFPGGEIASDPELARSLAGAIKGLELDARAHREEHAIEVLLPLIARLAPGTRVVGITVGGGSLAELKEFAAQLAVLVAAMPEPPFLLVSSDMNHFADEAYTRKVDRKALDAIESLDPDLLYETVTGNRISMCGMLPAVIVMEALRRLNRLRRCELVGYTTSAEASGDTHRVVGYAGVLFGA